MVIINNSLWGNKGTEEVDARKLAKCAGILQGIPALLSRIHVAVSSVSFLPLRLISQPLRHGSWREDTKVGKEGLVRQHGGCSPIQRTKNGTVDRRPQSHFKQTPDSSRT